MNANDRAETFAYHGRYLRLNVSSGQAEPVALSEGELRRSLGGIGLGVFLALREGGAAADPLAEAAPLVFAFSPLVDSPLTTSARFAVVGKSPLSGRINDSLAGGPFAIEGKRTGYDALVLVGRAAKPSLLVVDDAGPRLEPAGDLWGAGCIEAEKQLAGRLGPEHQFAVIGPAGEKHVRFALIAHAGRFAGRGGSGAVLGAKNLKAIAVHGAHRCRWSNPDRLAELADGLSQRSLGPATARYRDIGTIENLVLLNRLRALPTRNFQQGSFGRVAELSPERIAEVRGEVRSSCTCCTIGCEHLFPAGRGRKPVRLEYESLFALGPLCGIHDPEVVLTAVERANELGLDTISTGGTIAFAMECCQRGLVRAPWLRFGSGPALLRAVEEIGARRGLGNLMAEGTRAMARAVGGGSEAFAPHVKGLEIPGYEPRAMQTTALGFAVGTRGADHNRSGAYEADFSPGVDRRHAGPDAALHAVETEDRAAVLDSLVLCKFLRGVFTDFYAEAAELLAAATGWDVGGDELRRTAQRIVTAKKYFNILAGWQPEEDRLPARFLSEPLGDDPRAELSAQQLGEMVRAYNLARGWSPEGWVSQEQLNALGVPPLDHTMPA